MCEAARVSRRRRQGCRGCSPPTRIRRSAEPWQSTAAHRSTSAAPRVCCDTPDGVLDLTPQRLLRPPPDPRDPNVFRPFRHQQDSCLGRLLRSPARHRSPMLRHAGVSIPRDMTQPRAHSELAGANEVSENPSVAASHHETVTLSFVARLSTDVERASSAMKTLLGFAAAREQRMTRRQCPTEWWGLR